MMSAVPARAISGLLSEVVGNHSFRLKIGKTEGYIVYRNGYYMFQPDYLSDVRIPLALRVAEVPVKRDSFEPTQIKISPKSATVEPQDVAPGAEKVGSLAGFWKAIKVWAISMSKIPSESGPPMSLKDIPDEVQLAIYERYNGDDAYKRANDELIMVNWLHEHIQTSAAYTSEQKKSYLAVLGEALLQMIWDENIRPNEQLEILATNDDIALKCANEQIVNKGGRSATRIVDVMSGTIKYYCDNAPCAEAVAKIFETNAEDPLNKLKADNVTTAPIYGFMVPKGKEARVVFKTNDRPVAPGTKPEKGSECSIVSTISFHIKMLKDIAELMASEGYPKFILTEEYLDEKARKKKTKADGQQIQADPIRVSTVIQKKVEQDAPGDKKAKKVEKPFKTRNFENAIRACALKNIILRWLDLMQRRKEPAGKRFFYRPIASLKTGHKGSK